MDKLIIVINDSLACYDYYTHTGNMINTRRRTVEIELTEEQQNQINIIEKAEVIESISFKILGG